MQLRTYEAGLRPRCTMDPFGPLDPYVNVLAESIGEALIKGVLVVGCIGLTAFCVAAIVLRRRRD